MARLHVRERRAVERERQGARWRSRRKRDSALGKGTYVSNSSSSRFIMVWAISLRCSIDAIARSRRTSAES